VNIHKKLISIGFKRCEPHKPSNNWREPARKANRDHIKQLWLQGDEIKDKWGHTIIQEINIDNNLKSKSDIISLFPKRLQRDLIISELFK